MKARRMWGVALIIIGAAMFFFSEYIAEQVASGKMQLEQGKRQVKQVESLFSTSQYTKPVGKVFTGGAEKKIRAGEYEISKYEKISYTLKIGGIVFIVIGAFLLLFSPRRKA